MRKRHFYHTPADRIIDIIASVYDGNGNWIRDLEELSRGDVEFFWKPEGVRGGGELRHAKGVFRDYSGVTRT
jgi:hypothetical protein